MNTSSYNHKCGLEQRGKANEIWKTILDLPARMKGSRGNARICRAYLKELSPFPLPALGVMQVPIPTTKRTAVVDLFQVSHVINVLEILSLKISLSMVIHLRLLIPRKWTAVMHLTWSHFQQCNVPVDSPSGLLLPPSDIPDGTGLHPIKSVPCPADCFYNQLFLVICVFLLKDKTNTIVDNYLNLLGFQINKSFSFYRTTATSSYAQRPYV